MFFPEMYSNEHFQVDINIDVLIIWFIMLAKKWCLMPSLSAKSVRNVMILSLKTQNKILVRCNPCTKTWRDNCELTLFHPFYRHHMEIIIKNQRLKRKLVDLYWCVHLMWQLICNEKEALNPKTEFTLTCIDSRKATSPGKLTMDEQ